MCVCVYHVLNNPTNRPTIIHVYKYTNMSTIKRYNISISKDRKIPDTPTPSFFFEKLRMSRTKRERTGKERKKAEMH